MSLPPVEIPLGAMRFNSDSQKLEYWNGQIWMQIHTFSPNLDGGARGVTTGGYTGPGSTGNAAMDYFNIESAANAADFGDLNEVKSEGAASSSNTKGIFAGGYNGPSRTANTSYIINLQQDLLLIITILHLQQILLLVLEIKLVDLLLVVNHHLILMLLNIQQLHQIQIGKILEIRLLLILVDLVVQHQLEVYII